MSDERGTPARIVVTRRFAPALMDRFATAGAWVNLDDEPLTAAEIAVTAADHAADALVVTATDRVDAALIAALPPSVRAIATYSVGHDHLDLDAARARGIAVLTTPDVLSDAVSEMAVLCLLGAARRAHEGARLIYEGRWRGWSPTLLLGRDVTGGRLGVFGMGRIGRAVARRLARGFDMEVHYFNRSRLAPELEDGASYCDSAADLLAVSDFLVLAAPATPETARFLNADSIARLPPDAVVVNVARGGLVDDEALIAALRTGRVAAAGLDVFDGEPALHPGYLDLPNVFLQPHQGSATVGTRVRMGELLLDSVEAVLAGREVGNRVA
ncbi:2-hydroxyacid dehydrogenase [Lichenibacterium dinghuense]|uniref:2-hydroxyacid dehydrogenase n=1 Tax=Lichenibacterium dinghuense TaxID=2895977 RepID=UPI001F2A07FC|nr:D-glycerate dehydrogenase [Lichenibacterium sp. 6Y81]